MDAVFRSYNRGNRKCDVNICQGTSLCAVTVVEQIQKKNDPVLSQSELIEIDDPHFFKFIDE